MTVDAGYIFYRLVKIEQEFDEFRKQIDEDDSLTSEQKYTAELLITATNACEEARQYIREE